MKMFVFLLLLSIGCKDAPKDSYDYNREIRESNKRIERLEKLNDSLSEQLEKCSEFV